MHLFLDRPEMTKNGQKRWVTDQNALNRSEVEDEATSSKLLGNCSHLRNEMHVTFGEPESENRSSEVLVLNSSKRFKIPLKWQIQTHRCPKRLVFLANYH